MFLSVTIFAKVKCRTVSYLLPVMALMLGLPAKAETLLLTSLHWPPYSSSQLDQQGASIAVARAAVIAMGHQVKVEFYPWSRAVRLVGRSSSKYLGYLPAYSYPTEDFIFSNSLGSSPLGIVEREVYPIRWSELNDLNQYTLGVVRDYVNTAELDTMIKLGTQKVEVVTSDEHNVRKVASARVDAAVIDLHVLRYILSQGELQKIGNKLQVNKKLLQDKQLFIAFRNSPEGIYWRDIFNQGLAKIDAKLILDEYMEKVTKQYE